MVCAVGSEQREAPASACGGCRLGQVVADVDENLLMFGLVEAAPQKRAELQGLFGLAEDRYDGHIGQRVASLSPTAFETLRQGSHQAARRRGAGVDGRTLAVLLPTGGDVGAEAVPLQGLELVFRSVAGMVDVFSRQPARRPNLLERVDGLTMVVGELVAPVEDDDLISRIDPGICVAGLRRAVTGLDDAVLRVGEVALGLGPGHPRARSRLASQPFRSRVFGLCFGFQRRLAFGDPGYVLLLVSSPVGHQVTPRGGAVRPDLSRVGGGRAIKSSPSLGRECRLNLADADARHRLVLVSIGSGPGAVKRNVAARGQGAMSAQLEQRAEQLLRQAKLGEGGSHVDG